MRICYIEAKEIGSNSICIDFVSNSRYTDHTSKFGQKGGGTVAKELFRPGAGIYQKPIEGRSSDLHGAVRHPPHHGG